MTRYQPNPFAALTALALLAGCSGREVEVTGVVRQDASLGKGPITVLVAEAFEEGSADERRLGTYPLAERPGAEFAVNVVASWEKLSVYAFGDDDEDGFCSARDEVAGASVVIGEDDAITVELDLGNAPCPIFFNEE